MQRLIDKFGFNTPISIQDIRECYPNLTKSRVDQIVADFEKEQKLIRFSIGIYYIPTDTIFGKSKLNIQKVIKKKYIEDKNSVFGFYTGLSFMNMVGITTQVPNVIEISTNNESSRVRDVMLGKQQLKLRKSRVEVTKDNYKQLQLLDCLNLISNNSLEDSKYTLLEFTKQNNLNIGDLFILAREYPARVTKNLVNMGVLYGAI